MIKRKPLIFVGLSLCVGVLGAILEFNFINTIQRHTHHLSSVTNKEMIYEVKFLTQPIDIEGELTAFVRTKNDEKLQLKSYSTPKLPLLKPEFYATHSCLIKGKYKPALRSGQLGYLNVQSLHLNQCKPDPPSWSDRIRQLRNTYINHMRTSSIHGKDKLIALATGDIQFIDATVENSQNPNDHSIITFATIHQSTLLLMGDATTENEKRLLQKIKLPKINILKVGHHGSLTSTSQPFLAHIRPQYALISSAKNNVYQLPHPTILKRLQEINCITYNTADTHTLSIQFNPHQPRQYNIYNLTK
ncbi:hypothetical protein MTQ94_08100 [Staphylococcus agnetis]|uniref:ComEC/Rec2 family competence protein n=1 Tax=Staphylococcus agnetis TaxID=985762 RepID=UPI00208E0553|nr:hypothetical protein [Staphylococcus agnetis]MCO4343742.1 hypothetical protein [Staphylococcus agnetis]MCO4350360.1 hypothetical protein [Staphylococcus agnetis]MCO4353058.1 hypothetical protein [Staphylococcus agnetis]MCO4366973.1 hypothetical protein [Staphylococcus agnetis]